MSKTKKQIVSDMLEDALAAETKAPFVWTYDVVQVVHVLREKGYTFHEIHEFLKARGCRFSEQNMYQYYKKWLAESERSMLPSGEPEGNQ